MSPECQALNKHKGAWKLGVKSRGGGIKDKNQLWTYAREVECISMDLYRFALLWWA